jgi:hypothetical protein
MPDPTEYPEAQSEVQLQPKVSPDAGRMLPGVAVICIFLIVMTVLNVWAAISGAYGAGRARVGVLALCSLLAIGIFGMLRLSKWGWALVSAGCLLLATGDIYFFSRTHASFFLVRGLLVLVFFLYLVRPEIRVRLR